LSSYSKVVKHASLTVSEGFDLLTKEEQLICEDLAIYPKAYFAIKDALLKEYSYSPDVKIKHLKSLLKMENSKADKLCNFLVRIGWLPAK
jgi:hypothetical protein